MATDIFFFTVDSADECDLHVDFTTNVLEEEGIDAQVITFLMKDLKEYFTSDDLMNDDFSQPVMERLVDQWEIGISIESPEEHVRINLKYGDICESMHTRNMRQLYSDHVVSTHAN